MLKAIGFLASAGAVALIALIGHWQTDGSPGHDSAFATSAPAAPPPDAGVPWLPIVLILCGALGVIALAVAWMRRNALPFNRFTAPPTPPPSPTAHGRWHCILTVNGLTVRRDYVDWPATDPAAMAREIEERFVALYGAGLPPDARIHARVVPVYSK